MLLDDQSVAEEIEIKKLLLPGRGPKTVTHKVRRACQDQRVSDQTDCEETLGATQPRSTPRNARRPALSGYRLSGWDRLSPTGSFHVCAVTMKKREREEGDTGQGYRSWK